MKRDQPAPRGLPLRPALRELHARAGRQDVGHRLGVRRHDRPVLRPRRLLRRTPLVDDEERFVITALLRRPSTRYRYARMMLHKLVADLWWSIWAMIQVRQSQARLRLLRVRHEPGRALPRERRQARVPVVARDGLSEGREQRMSDDMTRPAGRGRRPRSAWARSTPTWPSVVPRRGPARGPGRRGAGRPRCASSAPWRSSTTARSSATSRRSSTASTPTSTSPATASRTTPIRELFVSLGYDEDLEINAFHAEGGRLIFNNPTSHIHVDVFMDKLDFCHPIPWKGRLEVDSPTIPLAELAPREDADRQDQREGHHRHDHAAARARDRRATTTTTSTPRTSPSCAPASGGCGAPPP